MEPIVPLRGLVELGYTITWSRAGCVVKHPRLGNIECWLRSGCPVVRKDHALALITEIEHMEMEKRTNHRLTLEEPTEKTKKWWGSRFPETPERIWNYMKGQDEEDPQMNHDFPWNRHKKEAAHLKRGYSPPLCWGTGEGMAKESHQWIFSVQRRMASARSFNMFPSMLHMRLIN